MNGSFIIETEKSGKDEGYILVTVLFILAILTMSAVAIATISQTESNIVRNERIYLNEFYNSDSAIGISSEGFLQWISTLKNSSEKNGYKYNVTIPGENGAGTSVDVEAVRIEDSYGQFNENISPFAKDLPAQKHIDDPLVGSGTGVTGEVMIRRYAITAKPSNGNVQLQAGVYKYIPGNNI